MRKKLLVFPFNYSNYLLATKKELITEYDVTAFVCTNNSPFCNQDAGIFVNRETGIVISDAFIEKIKIVDSILLTSGLDEAFADIYIEKIQIAQRAGKEILVTKVVLELIKEKNISLDGILCIDADELNEKIDVNELHEINTPIVTITGAGENCEKFDLQLSVRKVFMEENYRIFQVGSKEYSTVFGIHNFPEFIFSKTLSLPQKVMAFNSWIFKKVLEEKPDIIILGIPGGIMPLNNKIFNYFGEVGLIVSRALKIDVNILSLYFYDDIDTDFLENYKFFCKYSLNMPTNYFNISSNYFKYDEERNKYAVEVFHLDNKYVEQKFPSVVSSEMYVFNDCYGVGECLSSGNILNEFLDNIEVV